LLRNYPWLSTVSMAGLLALPFIVRVAGDSYEYYMRVITLAGIWVILALGVQIILGFTGMITFGHAAFYCIGAYTSALLVMRLGLSFWFALPSAALVAGLLGILLGIPSLRLRGDYLAVVTLAFGEIVRLVVVNWVGFTRGPMGLPNIPPPILFGIELHSTVAYYYLCLGLVIACVGLVRWLVLSPFGRAMMAVRDDDIAASAMGIDTFKVRLLAFALGGALAGVAGSFFAHYNGFISPENFGGAESMLMLLMVVLGGVGSIPGAILGAVILSILPEALRMIGQWRLVLNGFLMVVLILLRPQGLLGGKPLKVRIPVGGRPLTLGGDKGAGA